MFVMLQKLLDSPFLIYIGVSEVNTMVIMPQQSGAARRERVTSVCTAVAELLMVEQH